MPPVNRCSAHHRLARPAPRYSRTVKKRKVQFADEWSGLQVSHKGDYINTDNLSVLEPFLLENDPDPTAPYVSWAGSGGGGA
jgi:hypothetical protein